MGTYSYGEHLDLFGGPPEPGESYPSLDQVDELRKAAKEDPEIGCETCRRIRPVDGRCESCGWTWGAAPPPEPRCVVCDRETHTHEQLQACRSLLKRTDQAEIEEWRG